MQRDICVCAFIHGIHFAGIVRIRIDVHAGRGLIEFRQILHLVDGLFGTHDGGMRRIHSVGIGGDQLTAAVRGVLIFHAEILHAQTADGRDHPAILAAMIMDAAELADIPADREDFKEFAFVDQIPGVVAVGVKNVGGQGFRLNGFALGEFQHAGNGEFFFWNGAELFHPFINRDHFHRLFIFRWRDGAHQRASWCVCVQSSNTSLYRRVSAAAAENQQAAACYHEHKMPANDTRLPVNLLGQSAEELRAFMQSLGEPAYRGAQIYRALYAERRFDVANMSNLPVALRERLAREASIALPQIVRRYRSGDGTVRYVLALPATTAESGSGVKPAKPATVEAVFMPEENRQTICISTQAGCAVDCHFCLTAQLGLIRNLTAGEIVGQVLVALEENREQLVPQTNVVLMGQGEPLLNYDATMAAVRILLDPKGLALSPRHVTLSTSGIVPGIERLGQEKIRPSLAISLNASSDEQRDALMPINRKYPLEVLLDACRRYPLRPREYFTFEYVLLGGVNDSPEDARRVVRLLSQFRAKVNLIPWNPGKLPYRAPTPESIEAFKNVLIEKGDPAF